MYEIFFISYNEPNADNNWKSLKSRFPTARRINGIKGIHQAHLAAAKQSFTQLFYVVDGDAEILPEFNFDHKALKSDHDMAHVWRSRNPINDLEYGYGGVKLLPKAKMLKTDPTKVDMTTSLSDKFCVMETVSNVTAFNTDPFSTWRSAFRECVKLSSKAIDRQLDDETNYRLETWCTKGQDRPFGEHAIQGATAGRLYGSSNIGNAVELIKINDFDWLKEKFNEIQS